MALPLPAAHARPPAAFHASIAPLSPRVATRLRTARVWHRGCPVALSGLRVLTVTYRGFDGHPHPGRMVVNARGAPPLARAFRRLYGLHFPIRHMSIAASYGPI